MTVTRVDYLGTENTSSDSTGERSFVSTYQVITDSLLDGAIIARDATGIPFVNATLNAQDIFDNGVFADAYSVGYKDREASRLVWIVTVTFTSNPRRRNDTYEDDPVNQAPIISGGGVRFSTIVEQDRDGNPLVNSVNDIITGIEKDDDRPSLRIQKNFQTIDLNQFAEYSNSLNDATFFGLSAGKWKLSHPRWEQRFRGNSTPFYAVTFEFESKSETWACSKYDRGHYYLDAQGNKKRFTDSGGIVQSSPQNLDGTGSPQPGNLLPADAPNSPFDLYAEKDFSALNIPTSL